MMSTAKRITKSINEALNILENSLMPSFYDSETNRSNKVLKYFKLDTLNNWIKTTGSNLATISSNDLQEIKRRLSKGKPPRNTTYYLVAIDNELHILNNITNDLTNKNKYFYENVVTGEELVLDMKENKSRVKVLKNNSTYSLGLFGFKAERDYVNSDGTVDGKLFPELVFVSVNQKGDSKISVGKNLTFLDELDSDILKDLQSQKEF